MGIKIFIRDW